MITFTFNSFDETHAAFEHMLQATASATNIDRISRSHGDESITLRDGATIRFRTLTKRDQPSAAPNCGCNCGSSA